MKGVVTNKEKNHKKRKDRIKSYESNLKNHYKNIKHK